MNKQCGIASAVLFAGGLAAVIGLEAVHTSFLLLGLAMMLIGAGVFFFRAWPITKYAIFEGLYYVLMAVVLMPTAYEDSVYTVWILHLMLLYGGYTVVRFIVLRVRPRKEDAPAVSKSSATVTTPVLAVCEQCGARVPLGSLTVYEGKARCEACLKAVKPAKKRSTPLTTESTTAMCEACGRMVAASNIQMVNRVACCPSCASEMMASRPTAMDQLKRLFACEVTESNTSLRAPLYVLLWEETEIPLGYRDRLCVYSSVSAASDTVGRIITDPSLRRAIKISFITEEKLPGFWNECRAAGFANAVVDGGAVAPLSSMPRGTELREETPCASLCNGMLLFYETLLTSRCDQQSLGAAMDSEKLTMLEKHITGTALTVPLYGGKETPLIVEDRQGRWIALFTDRYALARYDDGIDLSCLTRQMIPSCATMLDGDQSLTGVVVNPGREAWKIPAVNLKYMMERGDTL